MGTHSKNTYVAICAASLLLPLVAAQPAAAQSPNMVRITAQSTNKRLPSLFNAALNARLKPVTAGPAREVPNMMRETVPGPVSGLAPNAVDPALQAIMGNAPITVNSGFFGASNADNATVVGFQVSPPDTDGSVGPNHFVQMINLVTTIFDKSGGTVLGPFASNAFWSGIGGNCEAFNQGDPIVLYDEQADRWFVSQFAFPSSFATFSQCVAISQTGDPTGAYNRYEFVFNNIGFNDYPKHGIVDGAITMMANLFTPPFFGFGGTFIGVMEKDAMYAGTPAQLIGFNLGTSEFGFVAGDLDGPGSAPALFATAMSTTNRFDIWEITPDFPNGTANAAQIASIPISPYDANFCAAQREACIPQPNTMQQLEVIADRLMHRLQIRDFGTYRTMVTGHSVDVGSGRAGIRWYEMRESTGTWSLYQEGTYAPNDGQNRWMPSIAMNGAGDIGIGYLLSSSNTFVSAAVSGQSASNSGTGLLDGTETICAAGSGSQTGSARAGDYSATSVDPTTDRFWHTNELVVSTGAVPWATFVCEFTVPSGGGTNTPPTASIATPNCTDLDCSFDGSGSSDSDGTIVSYAWDFGDGATGTGATTTHTYAAAGTYTVTLTVTDDDGATGTDTTSVTVTEPPPTGITLSLAGRITRRRTVVELTWSGATGNRVDVYRDGSFLQRTRNDGFFRNRIDTTAPATYSYQICERNSTTVCSPIETISLP